MIFLLYLLYVLIAIVFVLDCYLILKFFEFFYCAHVLKQPPMVASNKNLRKTIVYQINKYYKNAKNICVFGSGFGGLVRYISKNTGANVYSLENMPFSMFISKLSDYFSNTNNKTIWCNGFDYMDKTKIKFDIVVAYLSPDLTPKLLKYKNKMRVLISLDFKIKGLKPTRIIKAGLGHTIYWGKLYPHRLYIYEFK